MNDCRTLDNFVATFTNNLNANSEYMNSYMPSLLAEACYKICKSGQNVDFYFYDVFNNKTRIALSHFLKGMTETQGEGYSSVSILCYNVNTNYQDYKPYEVITVSTQDTKVAALTVDFNKNNKVPRSIILTLTNPEISSVMD